METGNSQRRSLFIFFQQKQVPMKRKFLLSWQQEEDDDENGGTDHLSVSSSEGEEEPSNEVSCDLEPCLTGAFNDREEDHVENPNDVVVPAPPLQGTIRDYEWNKLLRKMSRSLLRYLDPNRDEFQVICTFFR